MSVKCGVRARGVSKTQQGCARRCDLKRVCAKDNQPFLMTQATIAKIFKRVIGFCALRRGDAINVANSLESPET